ncbi:AP-2 medium chain [Pelomyxa schiedti]|nr:AP-2 medium chain [Pelomyxa schiedti]
MLSAIFFMNSKGDVLISRVYRDDVNRGVAHAFRSYILDAKEIRCPIKSIGTTTFLHIRVENIYVVAVTTQNVNSCVVFELLGQLVQLFEAYFNKVDEESIHNNFVLIYELLDEILDFGYPQYCDKEILQRLITQGQARPDRDTQANLSKITVMVTGAISWRSPDVKYKRNEIYIDVVESVNLLMSAKGTLLSADVSGQILLKVMLSGMPECTLGMNDRAGALAKKGATTATATTPARKGRTQGIAIDDFSFHHCVRLHKFDADRVISFVPPDGDFELMRYRTAENINLPFKIIHNITEIGHSRLDIRISVKSTFDVEMYASDVKISIPVPKTTAVCRIKAGSGRARYIPEFDAILWKIRRFPGNVEYALAAEIDLMHTMSEKRAWSRPPIAMEFQVPMFAASGLQIRFLKVVEKTHYDAIKWVRYVTKAGTYQYRI